MTAIGTRISRLLARAARAQARPGLWRCPTCGLAAPPADALQIIAHAAGCAIAARRPGSADVPGYDAALRAPKGPPAP